LAFLLPIAQKLGLAGMADGKLLAQEQTGCIAGQHLATKAWRGVGLFFYIDRVMRGKHHGED
jgi:hypothetical protein